MAGISPKDHDPSACQVCYEKYDDVEHSPHLLPCTHTYCLSCIDKIISMEINERRCPDCRTPIKANSSTEITLNRSTLVLAQMLSKINALTINPRNLTSVFETWQNSFSDDLNKKSIPFAINGKTIAAETIKKNNDEVAQCQREIERIDNNLFPALREIRENLNSHVSVIVKENESLSIMSEEFNQEQENLEEIIRKVEDSKSFATADSLTAEAEKTDGKLRSVMQQLKTANKHSNMMKELEETKRKLDMVADTISQQQPQQRPQHVQRLEEASSDGAISLERVINYAVTPRKLTVADIRNMSDPLRTEIDRGKVYASHNFNGKQMIGQIKGTDEEGEICIHHMEYEPLPSDSPVVEYSEIMEMVDSSCRLTFIDFERWKEEGRVFFHLFPDTEMGRQFFLMCSGEMGTSYAGGDKGIEVAHKGDSVYELLDINVNERLLEVDWGIEFRKEEYERPQVAGSLWAYYYSETDNGVDIFTKDYPQRNLSQVFGKIYKGLDVVQRLVSFAPGDGGWESIDCRIKDCGVVIRATLGHQ